MRAIIATLAVLALVSSTAQAQTTPSKTQVPIDPNFLIVKPVDTTTSIVGNTFRYVSRVTADAVSNDGFIKTINNLFKKRTYSAPTSQTGLSPLPNPTQYPSNYYKSPIQPQMPQYSVFRR